jgi:N-formylglutamate amidohydrolase
VCLKVAVTLELVLRANIERLSVELNRGNGNSVSEGNSNSTVGTESEQREDKCRIGGRETEKVCLKVTVTVQLVLRVNCERVTVELDRERKSDV